MKYKDGMTYLLTTFFLFCITFSSNFFQQPENRTIYSHSNSLRHNISHSIPILIIKKELGLDNEDDFDKLFSFSKPPFLTLLNTKNFPISSFYSEFHNIFDILSRSPPCAENQG